MRTGGMRPSIRCPLFQIRRRTHSPHWLESHESPHVFHDDEGREGARGEPEQDLRGTEDAVGKGIDSIGVPQVRNSLVGSTYTNKHEHAPVLSAEVSLGGRGRGQHGEAGTGAEAGGGVPGLGGH